jgi:hypothetical protein
LHCENIALHPDWMYVPSDYTACFTLFFSPLPKDCVSFDLIEKIPESGAFELLNIGRNNSDVYQLKFG